MAAVMSNVAVLIPHFPVPFSTAAKARRDGNGLPIMEHGGRVSADSPKQEPIASCKLLLNVTE